MSNIALLAVVAKGLGHLSKSVVFVNGNSLINKKRTEFCLIHSNIR